MVNKWVSRTNRRAVSGQPFCFWRKKLEQQVNQLSSPKGREKHLEMTIQIEPQEYRMVYYYVYPNWNCWAAQTATNHWATVEVTVRSPCIRVYCLSSMLGRKYWTFKKYGLKMSIALSRSLTRRGEKIQMSRCFFNVVLVFAFFALAGCGGGSSSSSSSSSATNGISTPGQVSAVPPN